MKNARCGFEIDFEHKIKKEKLQTYNLYGAKKMLYSSEVYYTRFAPADKST